MDDAKEICRKLNDFDHKFDRLKKNRENVPLEVLTTRYAEGYAKLVREVETLGKYCAWHFTLTHFPLHPEDEAGNAWVLERVLAIIEQERHPNGIYAQQRAALIERLDVGEFFRLITQMRQHIEQEAYDPYWQKHCYWVGQSGNRRIYNDIIDKFWDAAQGWWIDRQGNLYGPEFPPHSKEGLR